MVSNALDMELPDLLETLERFRRDYGEAQDPEYRDLRSALPSAWSL